MFPGISEKGYERCIGTWAEILYEVIVAAAEGERDKRMGITSWELYCPGARRGELEDVENKICMLVQTKSGYLGIWWKGGLGSHMTERSNCCA